MECIYKEGDKCKLSRVISFECPRDCVEKRTETEFSSIKSDEIDNGQVQPKLKVNRQYQDSFFKALFKEEKYQWLFLRDYCEGIDWQNVELENVELQNMFTIDQYNDVCFRAGNFLIVLIEHQSSINWNMPLRMLLYSADEYTRILRGAKRFEEILLEDMLKIPTPVFFVVYTGIKDWNVEFLKLSDAYLFKTFPFLELKIPVLTCKNSKGIVKEFTSFINDVKTNREPGENLINSFHEAVEKYSFGFEISDFIRRKEDIMDYFINQMTEEEKAELKQRLREKKMKEQEAAMEEKAAAMEEKAAAMEEKAAAILAKNLNITFEKALEMLHK